MKSHSRCLKIVQFHYRLQSQEIMHLVASVQLSFRHLPSVYVIRGLGIMILMVINLWECTFSLNFLRRPEWLFILLTIISKIAAISQFNWKYTLRRNSLLYCISSSEWVLSLYSWIACLDDDIQWSELFLLRVYYIVLIVKPFMMCVLLRKDVKWKGGLVKSNQEQLLAV